MRRSQQAGVLAVIATAMLCGAQLGAAAAADMRKGLEIARVICAGCHAVERGNLLSINPDAPSFTVLAKWPAMSEIALRAALQRPHVKMPNVVLAREDRDDIVAYIMGLREE